jgi:hypothetical protein
MPDTSHFEDNEQRDEKLFGEYYLALGKFINKHSEMEFVLNLLVRHYYKLTDETANLIFQMLRVDAALDHLQRLMSSKKMSEDDSKELEFIRNQIGMINRFRNDVVHYGIDAIYRKNRRAVIVTNRPFAFRNPRTYAVTPEVLRSAYRDVSKIVFRIIILMNQELRKDLNQRYGDVLKEPWQYKPPVL